MGEKEIRINSFSATAHTSTRHYHHHSSVIKCNYIASSQGVARFLWHRKQNEIWYWDGFFVFRESFCLSLHGSGEWERMMESEESFQPLIIVTLPPCQPHRTRIPLTEQNYCLRTPSPPCHGGHKLWWQQFSFNQHVELNNMRSVSWVAIGATFEYIQ